MRKQGTTITFMVSEPLFSWPCLNFFSAISLSSPSPLLLLFQCLHHQPFILLSRLTISRILFLLLLKWKRFSIHHGRNYSKSILVSTKLLTTFFPNQRCLPRIRFFQCDNGREFDNASFKSFCQNNGMVFRFSCPHTSPQNGKAERKIWTINNLVPTLLTHASLPPSFRHHALQMATYLLNILPSKLLSHYSPTQILYHRDPSYTYLRVFGRLCYPLSPSNAIHKLQSRSTPCVFLGYAQNHRGYRCCDLSTNKIIVSRHVVFDESKFPYAAIHTPRAHTYDFANDGLHPFFHNHLL